MDASLSIGSAAADTHHVEPGSKDRSIDQRVASRIRRARLSNGMSQTELARAMGLSLQQVHKYETGRNRIGPARLHEICSVLGVAIDSLFAEGDGRTAAAHPRNGRECLELVRYYQAMSAPERSAVLSLLRAIAETDDGDTMTVSPA